MNKPRMNYYYGNEEYLIPPRHIYRMNESQGGAYDLLASFFTEAFRKHNVAILGYKTLFGSTQVVSKNQSKKGEAAQTIFAVECIGMDQWGRKVAGIGEVSSESITTYQRKYPYNLAAKRARTTMGKEIFGITDIKMAIDCRDYEVPVGKHKGKTIEEVARIDRGVLNWILSDDFNATDNNLKPKIEEYFERYLNNPNNNNTQSVPSMPNKPQEAPTNNTQNPQTQNNNNQPSGNSQQVTNNAPPPNNPSTSDVDKISKEQAMAKLKEVKENKNLGKVAINRKAKELFDKFNWDIATTEQIIKLTNSL